MSETTAEPIYMPCLWSDRNAPRFDRESTCTRCGLKRRSGPYGVNGGFVYLYTWPDGRTLKKSIYKGKAPRCGDDCPPTSAYAFLMCMVSVLGLFGVGLWRSER